MYRQPVDEIASLYETEHTLTNVMVTPGSDPLGNLTGELFHIKTQIELGTATSVGLNIRGTQVRYDVASQTLSALGRSAPLAPINGKIDLELLVDRSSLELFGGGGLVSMTSGFTPSAGNQAIDLFATGGNARVVSLSAFELQPAWPSQQPIPNTGLISRWGFNDPTLTAGFADTAGQDFNLANSGALPQASGIAGKAADFDNDGDYAFMPDHAAMNADSFSISLWVNLDNIGQASHIVGKANYSQAGSWGIEQLGDGRLKFFVRSASGDVAEIESAQPVNAGTWHHTVASYNSDLGRLELFVDGKLSAASEDEITGSIAFDQAPFIVGRRVVGSNPLNAIDGKIDELQLYGNALTPGEIDFLHNHPGVVVDSSSYVVGGLKLQVNTDTGAVAVINGGATSTALKGYSILSNRGGLNVSSWQSLDDRTGAAFAGWQEANPTPSALSEINPSGTFTIGPAARLNFGTPAGVFPTPKFGTAVRNTEFAFEYVAGDGQIYHGNVEFIGSRVVNNLELSIDPSTGQVVLANTSPYTVSLLGYSITSEDGSLRPTNGMWNSLADQGHTGVEEANASPTNLSELIPLLGDAIVLLPGETLYLGAAYNTAKMADLQFEFYLENDPLSGDFTGDGKVDAADYVVWRKGLGTLYSEGDYDVWRNNFGRVSPATPTIITGDLSYRSLAGMSSSVPEPATVSLLATLIAIGVSAARKPRWSTRTTSVGSLSRSSTDEFTN